MLGLKISATHGKARAGFLKTAHGRVETPFFMPVATKGSIKLISNEEAEKIGIECLISNSFILSMRPGVEIVERGGGLHKFTGWKKSLFTDSGGFQVLSGKFCLKLTEEGVLFRNPFNGEKMMYTPEKAMEVQNRLGGDVAMCLDDVPRAGVKVKRLRESAERTFEWAKQCKESHKNKRQMLFGICQGGIHKKLREKSTGQITSIGFDGYAIGGLAIGEPMGKMVETVQDTIKLLPGEKPRYLMGLGSVKELVKAISLGVDCFDSAFPTRTGRQGKVFTSNGHTNIDAACHRNDYGPLDKNCGCYVCGKHSRAYIHHLFRTREENARKYIAHHNLAFVQKILKNIRRDIREGNFTEKRFMDKLGKGNLDG